LVPKRWKYWTIGSLVGLVARRSFLFLLLQLPWFLKILITFRAVPLQLLAVDAQVKALPDAQYAPTEQNGIPAGRRFKYGNTTFHLAWSRSASYRRSCVALPWQLLCRVEHRSPRAHTCANFLLVLF
jgi:hypothetical protein